MMELSSFVNVLDKEPLIGSFNTIIGYFDARLFHNDEIVTKEENETLFQLLVRAENGTSGLSKKILDTLNLTISRNENSLAFQKISIINYDGKDIEQYSFERPFYSMATGKKLRGYGFFQYRLSVYSAHGSRVKSHWF